MHLSQKITQILQMWKSFTWKPPRCFFPRTLFKVVTFFQPLPPLAVSCFQSFELRIWSHTALHCPLSGFVSDQIFAAPGFSGLHRKKASACAGATVTDQLVPCSLGLSAGWTGNLCMGVVDGIESAEKSAESIVYVRFKYVYCKNIQLIISFISISYSTSVINIKILSFSASLGDAARTQFVNLKKKNSTAMTQAPANKRHFATAKAL